MHPPILPLDLPLYTCNYTCFTLDHLDLFLIAVFTLFSFIYFVTNRHRKGKTELQLLVELLLYVVRLGTRQLFQNHYYYIVHIGFNALYDLTL